MKKYKGTIEVVFTDYSYEAAKNVMSNLASQAKHSLAGYGVTGERVKVSCVMDNSAHAKISSDYPLPSSARCYYLREKGGGRRLGTVILMPYEDIWLRGISLCSLKEPFNRYTGKRLALSRVLCAAALKWDEAPVSRDEALNVLSRVDTRYLDGLEDDQSEVIYKTGYKVKLTPFERKLLKKKKTKTIKN